MGSDDPDVPGNDGRPKNNVFHSNTISNVEIGVHIKEGDDNSFTGEKRNRKESPPGFRFHVVFQATGMSTLHDTVATAILLSCRSFASLPSCWRWLTM